MDMSLAFHYATEDRRIHFEQARTINYMAVLARFQVFSFTISLQELEVSRSEQSYNIKCILLQFSSLKQLDIDKDQFI